jgi:hypothetical protein
MKPLQQNGPQTISVSLYLAFGIAVLIGAAPQVRAQAISKPSRASWSGSTQPEGSGSAYPDAPSVVYLASVMGEDAAQREGRVRVLPPCPPLMLPPPPSVMPSAVNTAPPAPCLKENPLRIVVNSEQRQPLTSRQKGILALRDVSDPFNLVVIAGEAGFGIGLNSHSAYGPGFKGFGKLVGYYLLQDAQGEFFGTFLIPSLVHEDPRYRRMQNASVKRRIFHALKRTVIAEHDDGRPMLNYATLLTYPISAELSNLYVPGIQSDGGSTAKRIGIGLATDPISNLIAEFLPDIARRVHVRSIFVQQLVNQMATGQPLGNIE